ncbi:MAG: asparagine synthase C-terminal domain-containing protein [Candidatus Vogelbacteria bacterium]|nr:asparagine synthase C-terminal domain-containing protein [Candidatus Vogelbacteria bacterium]
MAHIDQAQSAPSLDLFIVILYNPASLILVRKELAMLTNWRKAIALPIISKSMGWNILGLEATLTRSFRICAGECLKLNNGTICLTLSGGLDSSFYLAKIRRIFGLAVPIHTFTIGHSAEHPDILFARIVSAQFGTTHHEFIPPIEEVIAGEQELRTLWPDEPPDLGNVAVFLLYRLIAGEGHRAVIAHDGIDELLGGYWDHRKHSNEAETVRAFLDYWGRLESEHLAPLQRKADLFGLEVILPYLQEMVVEYIARIPVGLRTSREQSKIPLRALAGKYLPIEIVQRAKRGFCSALYPK